MFISGQNQEFKIVSKCDKCGKDFNENDEIFQHGDKWLCRACTRKQYIFKGSLEEFKTFIDKSNFNPLNK